MNDERIRVRSMIPAEPGIRAACCVVPREGGEPVVRYSPVLAWLAVEILDDRGRADFCEVRPVVYDAANARETAYLLNDPLFECGNMQTIRVLFPGEKLTEREINESADLIRQHMAAKEKARV